MRFKLRLCDSQFHLKFRKFCPHRRKVRSLSKENSLDLPDMPFLIGTNHASMFKIHYQTEKVQL